MQINTKNPFIDLHAHLQFDDFDQDREDVINQMKENNVIAINVGTDKKSSEDSILLAQKYNNILYTTIGLHPLNNDQVYDMEDFFINDKYKDDKVNILGIGECGLDYFRIKDDVNITENLEKIKEIQKEVFINQIKLSIKYNIPLMLHVRDSYRETLGILKENFKGVMKEYKGNVHFFAGTIEEAKEFLDLGFSISFTGVITFVDSYRELVDFVPIDRMFAETDSPYVAPTPFRGKRNNPNYVIEVYKKIAEIKNMDINDVIDIFYNNAKKHWIKS